MKKSMTQHQENKAIVLDFYNALDQAEVSAINKVLHQHTSVDYHFRGMHPFYEQHGAEDVAEVFLETVQTIHAPDSASSGHFYGGRQRDQR